LKKNEEKDELINQIELLEKKIATKLITKSQKKFAWIKQSTLDKQNDKKPKDITPERKADKGYRRFIKRSKWKRIQDRKKKETISAVYNHSSLNLTEAMTKILNRGLNFCVTPLTLNLTEVLVDYRKYERKVKWVEFFSDQNEDNDPDTEIEWKPEIFRKEKSNLPPNTSNAVKTFLNSVKSDITGSTFNKTRSNISKDETEALKTLVKLQRNCVIVIKPCDKGAGIIIVDHAKYV
jgi:hypothetical protein